MNWLPSLSYLLGVRKPRPDAFERTLDTLGLAAREVLFIDDQPDNVAAARELGLHAHRFSGADRLRAELDAAGLLPSAG